MSVSEQEAMQQIADMRDALRSMKGSAVRARIVSVVGVIVGFAIVGIYVYLFIGLGANLVHSKQFRPLVEERIKTMDLQKKLEDVARQTLPTYVAQARKTMDEMDWTPVRQEMTTFAEDIKPVLQSELDRVWPDLQDALIKEGNQGATDLEAQLQKDLNDRLQAMVDKHTAQIERETGLSAEKANQAMGNISAAGQAAIIDLLHKRWLQNRDKLIAVADLVDQLPPLPSMTEQELLLNLRATLIALAKAKLPDYDLRKEIGQPLKPKGTMTTQAPKAQPAAAAAAAQGKATAEAAKAKIAHLEEILKGTDLTDTQRQEAQKALDEAKASLNNG